MCIFNKPVREARQRQDHKLMKSKEWYPILRAESYCLVHNCRIVAPLWTVCGHGTDMESPNGEIPRPEHPMRDTGH